ncbi:hypothetical protein PSI15_14670 [Xenorhabdus sp. PR6a]|uniref:hypothetical protein n=1 Tax=Xenorhabdus sp. PR6a TaxID=3025877 RepID=UPI002358C3F9|nr:hypothetical protein [Xenorhabdus sp. PR6a]MDC9582794.1 hypothetical protein [Xenorhabdus sp. PR6a]
MSNNTIELSALTKHGLTRADIEDIIRDINGAYNESVGNYETGINIRKLRGMALGLLEAMNKLAKYENMEPVAYYNLIDDEVRKNISEFDENKTIYAVLLYMCPSK